MPREIMLARRGEGFNFDEIIVDYYYDFEGVVVVPFLAKLK